MARGWMTAFASAAVLATATTAYGTDRLARDDIQWRQMFPGVEFAPAYGDWEKGAHGKYVRIDRSAQVPLHTHNGAYHAVMISGRMANLFEGGARVELGPGDYFYMAGNRPHAHACLTDEPCFFYTTSDQLWDIDVPGQ